MERIFMLAVAGIYDGKHIQLLENVRLTKPMKVIITFVEELPEYQTTSDVTGAEMRKLAQQSGSFAFLDDPEEDIYTDRDLKVKY
jgi:predicted ferric reductase